MTKRKDGRWMDSVTINGKRQYFYGKTKSEVAQKVRDATQRTRTGKKFPDVSAAWWRKHEPTIASNTTKGYIPALRRADEFFAVDDIGSIRPVDISRFINHMIDDHDMAEKTAKTQLLVVNLVFHFAVMEGLVDFNPCADIRIPKGLRHDRREAADLEDIERVKASADLPFGLFPLIMLTCGLRDCEVLALRWRDVDLVNRDISVRSSVYHVGGAPQLKSPKTKAGIRKVPILDVLLPHLQPGDPDEFLFGGDKPYGQHKYLNEYERYKKASGVTCTPYQLRHAYATALWEAGVDELLASKLLGHAQTSTTHDVYTHIRDAHAARERRKIIEMKVV